MKNKPATICLSFFLFVLFVPNAYAGGDMDGTALATPDTGLRTQFQEGLDIFELEKAKNECRKKYEGLMREICLKEAQLAYEQTKTGTRPIRDLLQEKDLVDNLYQPGLDLIALRRKYFEEKRKFEDQHKMADFDNDIAYCRFEKIEASLRELSTGRFSKEFPDAVSVMDAQNENSLSKTKLAKRKAERIQAEEAVVDALSEGRDSRELCAGWDVPYNLLTSDVLQKCRPHLISEMEQISELSKRAEAGFKTFKIKREEEVRNAGRCLAECRDLKPAIDRLNSLNPYPFNKCAERMLRQESGPDLVDQVKEKLNSKIRDLHTRYERIKNSLGGTPNVIDQCDWRALETIKSNALRSMPEENCIRNYQTFSDFRKLISDLDRRKQVRLNEFGYLRLRFLEKITSCERYLKTPGSKENVVGGKTWDKNAVDYYNLERQRLDGMVREAYEKRSANCIPDLIARANSLPKTMSLTPGRVPDAAGTQWTQKELGFSGTWTRQGSTKQWIASWPTGCQRSIITMEVSGNRITAERRDDCSFSRGLVASYEGEIKPNGKVEGTRTITNAGTVQPKELVNQKQPWSAIIIK